MSPRHGTAHGGSTATAAIVTVDRITDAHRRLFPVLPPAATHIVALYRDNVLFDVSAAGVGDIDALPLLNERAREVAASVNGTYWAGCPWDHVNNCPDRAEHERWHAGSESTWRQVAA